MGLLLYCNIYIAGALEYLFNNFSVIAGLFLLVLSYILGVIMDYINASIFECFKSQKEKDFYKKHVSVIWILHNYPDIQKFLDMHYSRLRITRAVIVNTPAISLALFCSVLNHSHAGDISIGHTSFLIFISGLIFFFVSIVSYKKRMKTYFKYISQTLRLSSK
jgi:hypothetical protein